MSPWEAARGMVALTRLGWQTGFRLRGAYWKWRWETAWGKQGQPASRWRAALEYGAWVARMRRLRG